jgi:hypothetical protein
VGNVTLSDGIRTGSVLTLSQGETVSDSLSLVVQADCSGDGQFSITDMLMVKSQLLGLQTFSAAQEQAADVSGDDSVTITDFLQMKSNILALSDFSLRYISNAAASRSLILAIGDTYTFGPTENPLPEAPTEETTGESAEGTEEESPRPPAVEVLGDAITWEAGTATAVKLGTSLLTWGEETLLITVCQEALKVSLPDSTLFIGPGSSTKLNPTLNHPAPNGILTYSVSDSNILKVDQNGMLTALAEGTAAVTVTLPNGAKDTQEVTVIELIESLTLERTISS